MDKKDVDNLKIVPTDLSKLRNVVYNDVAKKTKYDKLFGKVNNIDTSGFALKTKYDRDKSSLEKKISDADKMFQVLAELLKKKQIIMLKILK